MALRDAGRVAHDGTIRLGRRPQRRQVPPHVSQTVYTALAPLAYPAAWSNPAQPLVGHFQTHQRSSAGSRRDSAPTLAARPSVAAKARVTWAARSSSLSLEYG